MFKVIALFILSILFLYTSAAPTFEKDINQPTTNSTKSWEAAHQLPRMVLDPTASLRESDKIVILAYRQQIDQYFNVASVAYWLYEYFLTIIPEISFIWPSRWTSVKVLYLLTRYSPFVDSGLAIPAYIISTATTEMCMNLNIAHTIFVYIGIVFAEVMLVYRVWVVWNQGQWMGCGLFVFSIISMNTAMGLTLAVLSSSEVVPNPPLGCAVVSNIPLEIASLVFILGYSLVLVVLMSARYIHTYRNEAYGDVAFVRAIQLDGLVPYLFLLSVSLCSMLTTIFTAPEDYGLLMLRFQRITHSVVACRVVLQTKARLKGQQDGPLNDIHGDPGFDTATLEGQDK